MFWFWWLFLPSWLAAAFSSRVARFGPAIVLTLAVLFALTTVATWIGAGSLANVFGMSAVGLFAALLAAALVVNVVRFFRWRPPHR
jgi:hypothetical protein